MSDIQHLVDEIAALPENQYRFFIKELAINRREKYGGKFKESPEDDSRDSVAQWVAHNHMFIDPGIIEVWYLPEGAPENEIRLLEVNAMLNENAHEQTPPVDFGFDEGNLAFRLFVWDVSPTAWKRIQEGEVLLPPGWNVNRAQLVELK
jgi:hypothetical protein